ncbi:flagellar biosynthesis protein FlhF [Neobacillus mesonae]|nr:flagellar biosynthesis protein FlhF [Neobacillus mesonae]
MRVKKYIVDTMPEAMGLIRSELGSDAVILSTKTVKTGGFAGLFRKQKIEVVAAVEEREPSQPSMNTPSAQSSSIPRTKVPDAYRKIADEVMIGQQGPVKESQEEDKVLPDKTAISQERVTAPPSNPAHQSHQERAEISAASSETLLEEIHQLKTMMSVLTKHQAYEAILPGDLNEVRARLINQGVIDELWTPWINSMQEAMADHTNQSGFDMMQERVKQFLDERIEPGIDPGTRIVYIAGPTGVGKTTTIAKLAAEQMFQHKRKVGLITADTYRISAIEQLRTYASILGVPLEVVQSPADTKRAMERLQDCDLIFMDTAGRNYRNEILVSELKSLLLNEPNSEMMLVLSMTSKTEDMLVILDHFTKFGLQKVIFTKTDETDSLGAMLNVLHQYPVTLSYITNGQNVPDDILLPDAKQLSDCIIGSEIR